MHLTSAFVPDIIVHKLSTFILILDTAGESMFFASRNQNYLTVKRGAGRALMAVFCILVALMIAFGAAARTFLPVYAAEYTAYDRSAI